VPRYGASWKELDKIMKKLNWIILALLLAATAHADVREPAAAGTFYPENPHQLSAIINNFFINAPNKDAAGEIIALLCPHAGYIYSGQTAACGYKLLKNKTVKNVILIGNSHNFNLRKGAVYSKGAFKTPLGTISVNEELAQKIISKTLLLEHNTYAHEPEHSLEVEIPFLIEALRTFKIVPILLSGSFTLNDCRDTAKAISDSLKELRLDGTAIIIASSDMSHYPSWANANMIDGKALNALKKFDPVILDNTISDLMSLKITNESCVFCGKEALYTVMYAAKNLGANNAEVLNYTNSGDISGDKSRVVGYAAVAFTEVEPKGKEADAMEDFKISEKNQKELLKIARESILHYLKTGDMPEYNITDKELTTPRAVFVTLNKNRQLRGCIGTTEPQAPLYEAVSQMAVAAAVQDYRFRPVSMQELDNVHIEISILSPMKRIKDHSEIIPNKHGVVVRSGFSRGGLFLPQVWEHFDSKEGFMSELCSQKAGLPRNAWKDPKTELYTFTVFSFEE
jgi:hypothetical protein